jgi:hypothetical protein
MDGLRNALVFSVIGVVVFCAGAVLPYALFCFFINATGSKSSLCFVSTGAQKIMISSSLSERNCE